MEKSQFYPQHHKIQLLGFPVHHLLAHVYSNSLRLPETGILVPQDRYLLEI